MSIQTFSHDTARSEVLQWLTLGGLESRLPILEFNGYDDLYSISLCNNIEKEELCGVLNQSLHSPISLLVDAIRAVGIDTFRLSQFNTLPDFYIDIVGIYSSLEAVRKTIESLKEETPSISESTGLPPETTTRPTSGSAYSRSTSMFTGQIHHKNDSNSSLSGLTIPIVRASHSGSAYSRPTSLFASVPRTPKSPRTAEKSVDEQYPGDIDINGEDKRKKRKEQLNKEKLLSLYVCLLKEGSLFNIIDSSDGFESRGVKAMFWATPTLDFLVYNSTKSPNQLAGFVKTEDIKEVREGFSATPAIHIGCKISVSGTDEKEWFKALRALYESRNQLRSLSGWIPDEYIDGSIADHNKQSNKATLVNGVILRKINDTIWTTQREAVRMLSCPAMLDRLEWSDPSKQPRKALNYLEMKNIIGVYTTPREPGKLIVMSAKRSLELTSLSDSPLHMTQFANFVKALRYFTSNESSLI